MHKHPHVATAESYYQAYVEGDLDRVAAHVHPDVRFKSPTGEAIGKPEFLGAARNLISQIRSIEFRAGFGSDSQAMLAYDLFLNDVEQPIRAAVLMGFVDGLIAGIELFFDPTPLTRR